MTMLTLQSTAKMGQPTQWRTHGQGANHARAPTGPNPRRNRGLAATPAGRIWRLRPWCAPSTLIVTQVGPPVPRCPRSSQTRLSPGEIRSTGLSLDHLTPGRHSGSGHKWPGILSLRRWRLIRRRVGSTRAALPGRTLADDERGPHGLADDPWLRRCPRRSRTSCTVLSGTRGPPVGGSASIRSSGGRGMATTASGRSEQTVRCASSASTLRLADIDIVGLWGGTTRGERRAMQRGAVAQLRKCNLRSDSSAHNLGPIRLTYDLQKRR